MTIDRSCWHAGPNRVLLGNNRTGANDCTQFVCTHLQDIRNTLLPVHCSLLTVADKLPVLMMCQQNTMEQVPMATPTLSSCL